MSDLEGLKKQRSVYRGILTKLLKFASGISQNSDESIEEMRFKSNRAKEVLDKIDTVEASIFAIDSEEESKMGDAEDCYYAVVTKLNDWIKKRGLMEATTAHGDTSFNMTTTGSAPEVRLAKLQIPIFSGDYTEWQSFYDLFHSSIHSRESITPVQKFQYLKGLLKGDAFSLVKHFKVTESNYIEALRKLTQRYDRKRHTINAFIRSYVEQPTIHTASASNIRKLLDTSDEVIRGLKALGDQAESRDPWLIYLLQQKLDDETRSLWAQENTTNEFPAIQEFFDFLIKRTDALESVRAHSTKAIKASTSIKSKNSFAITTDSNCIACNKEQHRLIDCDRFKGLSIEDRRSLIGSKRRCFNCLNPGHSVYDCKTRGRCRHCSRKHHTLVHIDTTSNASASTDNSSRSNEDKTVAAIHTCLDDVRRTPHDVCLKSTMQTVLPTAMVNILDNLGIPRLCRALLDTASQASFITETSIQRLMLPRTNCRTLIAGINQSNGGASNGSTTLRMASRFNDVHIATIQALIVPRITSSLPSFEFNPGNIHNLGNIDLADPNFCKPGNIDILLGADITFELLEGGTMKLDNTNMKAHKSKLGWIIGGRHTTDQGGITQSLTTIVNIDATLRRFWEFEELPHFNKMSKEEEDCEAWFKATTTRAEDGKFVTKIPFKRTQQALGSTYQQSLSRLLAMERRFKVDLPFRKLYKEFMQEYEDLRHMQPIEITNTELRQLYILPHHGVFKHSSSTTKLRVVFDASAKSFTGVSLNDNLMVGPNVQSSLFHIIMRFRQNPYVLVGDIEKMYRQVRVNCSDTRHQLILWRDKEGQIRPYALNTVTYGMASAAFMATRCLNELALEHKDKHPAAARAVERDIYVDDLMTGTSKLSELFELHTDIVNILSSGGFKLRKMSSNSPEMRKLLNNNDTTSLKVLSDHPEPATILGIAWDAHSDQFIFQVQLDDKEVHTKRSFLSEASKIFDPLGFLSPITVKIKILFQSLWTKKIDWDEQLSSETRSAWIDLRNSISRTPQIRIPRCIAMSDTFELHGFCDASKWAYAAVVYSRSQNCQGDFVCHLICSKTKVAPLKQVSIPRLELMAAVLLNRLINEVKSTLSPKVSSITMWTDSRIVLDWLSSPPRRWTTFVANRTSEIIVTNKRDRWRYVPSKQNPADYASRGLSAREINNNEMWWTGPPWLKQTNDHWPDQPKERDTTTEIAVPIQVYDATIKSEGAIESHVLDKVSKQFSNYFQMQKILAYMIRFIHNIRTRDHRYGTLLPSELDRATQYLAIHYQIRDFPEEYRCLRDGKPISLKSKLRQLNPFIDEEGIMRVGGRIQKSALPYSSRHPIILSHTAPIAIPITRDVHEGKQHPGINLLNSLVRQNFWIIRGKDVAKRVFQRCVKCLRQRPKMMGQLMGQLPADRVNYTVPFGAIGIDFCGPFKIHPVRRRGSIPVKAYLCVVVCFATHAIHIEVCMNLSTDSFLGAIRRFIGRRGLCHTIYCDNATNFVGARNHLKEVDEFLKTQGDNIASKLLQDGIEWRFIPPASPHQGGLWESAVKSIKTQLTRTIGTEILTLEEFSTLVTQIESVLNSRPLYSTDSDEPDFLTPAHFIIGRSIHQLPNPENKIKLSPHARWDIVNHIYQHFWRRWQLEYLHTLQTRTKWQTQSKNLQLDDIVLIHDNSLQPTQWLMGRILKLYPGHDGHVRVADIKTRAGTLKRPIQKLCRLPSFESHSDSTRGVCSGTEHLKIKQINNI